MNSVDIDDTNFVSKCTTHIKCAKCDLKLDSHFKTVKLSRIGSKIWREERFPKLQDLDSQLEGSNQVNQCQRTRRSFAISRTSRNAKRRQTIQLTSATRQIVTTLKCHVSSGGNVGVNSNTAETNEPQNGNLESTCQAPLASALTVDCAINNEVAETVSQFRG